RHYCLATGHRALGLGLRSEALTYLRQAAAWQRGLRVAWPMLALARWAPSDGAAARLYGGWTRCVDVLHRLLTGRLSLSKALDKALRQLLKRSASLHDGQGERQTVTDVALADLHRQRAR
ncbi:hypothetical protein, partial [Sphaerotilus sp.]|uniref:hypothetical protein n=1 Tax=Sphaerotilus sp. TaxID=2093942 RepID=UPI0034E1EDD2